MQPIWLRHDYAHTTKYIQLDVTLDVRNAPSSAWEGAAAPGHKKRRPVLVTQTDPCERLSQRSVRNTPWTYGYATRGAGTGIQPDRTILRPFAGGFFANVGIVRTTRISALYHELSAEHCR